MNWSELNFKKYAGMTLPQVIFKDPDWFFFMCEEKRFKGKIALEAQELYRRARSIKVPQRNGQKMLVEYIIHRGNRSRKDKFGTMSLIEEGPGIGNLNVASNIDFYVPRSCARYDKQGYKNFVRALKDILFGNPSKRMNRKACEEFFNNDNNFDFQGRGGITP